ncbi:nucleoside hydrolase [Paenibacillus sp. GCM10023252]|uniref:nucleoside hydrolase n=1 Tax=Paenibacillus sp. GCM10023252 TaxID=3252649 RepID=UPI0036161A9E
MTTRIILDTDIGTDVDDAMALALAMRSPELQLEGVTTVYGDVHLRARMAAKLLQLGGRSDVRVMAGIQQPLLHNRKIWWPGYEGVGVIEEDETIAYDSQHAVDFIIDTILSNPGEITLVPIGPLTNIAVAIIREPRIVSRVREVVMMGGVTRLGDNGRELPHLEHNIKCDPESASLVFRSGMPIVMAGLDVTNKVLIGRDDIERLRATGTALNAALVSLLTTFFNTWNMDESRMHDPLAVSILLDRTLVQTERMKVTVEYDHREAFDTEGYVMDRGSGQTVAIRDESGQVDVCLDVDGKRMMSVLMERLC